ITWPCKGTVAPMAKSTTRGSPRKRNSSDQSKPAITPPPVRPPPDTARCERVPWYAAPFGPRGGEDAIAIERVAGDASGGLKGTVVGGPHYGPHVRTRHC